MHSFHPNILHLARMQCLLQMLDGSWREQTTTTRRLERDTWGKSCTVKTGQHGLFSQPGAWFSLPGPGAFEDVPLCEVFSSTPGVAASWPASPALDPTRLVSRGHGIICLLAAVPTCSLLLFLPGITTFFPPIHIWLIIWLTNSKWCIIVNWQANLKFLTYFAIEIQKVYSALYLDTLRWNPLPHINLHVIQLRKCSCFIFDLRGFCQRTLVRKKSSWWPRNTPGGSGFKAELG